MHQKIIFAQKSGKDTGIGKNEGNNTADNDKKE